MLQGTVHLELRKPFPSRQLQLLVIGQEKTKWKKKQKDGKEQYKKKHKGNNRFLFLHQNLHIFDNGMIPPGQYSFPFQVLLPNWIPSSYMFVGKNKAEMKVTYKIKSMIEGIEESSGSIV